MKPSTWICIASLAVVPACTTTRYSVDPPDPAAAARQNPDALLKEMSGKLGAAKHFSFSVKRIIAPALATKLGQDPTANIEVTASRPDKVVARTTSKSDVRHLYSDGQSITLVDAKENFHSTVKLATTLDTLSVRLSEMYGFAPPLGEFLLSDPYQDIKYRTSSITYAGTGTVSTGQGVVKCHRIALAGKHADTELWLSTGDLLPRRMTATIKGISATHSSLDLQFTNWNLAANPSGQSFTYQPTAGSVEIEMIPVKAGKPAR